MGGEPSGWYRSLRIFLAEFLGTFLLVLFGDASIVQASYLNPSTEILCIALGYGLALMIAIHSCVGVSGAHLNPAVTLSMVAAGHAKPRDIPVYWAAQYAGAFTAAAVVYGVYADLINYRIDGEEISEQSAAGYFATYPNTEYDAGYLTLSLDELLGTAVLLVIVHSVIDERNCQVPTPLQPLVLGLGLAAIVLSFVSNGGAGVNPARDFGPRLFTWLVWGKDVWRWPEECDPPDPDCDEYEYFFWVPWLLPHLGALLGTAVYAGFVSLWHEGDDEDHDPDWDASKVPEHDRRRASVGSARLN